MDSRARIRRRALTPTLAVAAAVAAIVAVPALAAPSSPTVTGTSPASPANENDPTVSGAAPGAWTVQLYTDAACSAGNEIGSPSSDSVFASSGISVNVADDSTTKFYATATDGNGTSPCSTTFVTYVEDSTAPAVPTVDSTDPASPANENDPKVIGSAETGSTVDLYATDDCTGTVAASGPESDFSSTGIAVNVADDSTTTFHATATDAAGNLSPCSATSAEYVEDSTSDTPTFTGTDPASPANENNPKVQGGAESGSTVKLYTTADCSGTAAATGPESDFASTGLAVSVGDDTTTTVYGTPPDAPATISACSTESITYVEASPAPEAPNLAATNPIGPANDNNPELV